MKNQVESRDVIAEQRLALEILRLANEDLELKPFLEQALDLLRQWCRCEILLVRLREGNASPCAAVVGELPERLLLETELCWKEDDGCLCGAVLAGTLADGEVFWTNDLESLIDTEVYATTGARLRNRCLNAGYRSAAILPLKNRRSVLGLLQLADSNPGAFDLPMIAALEHLTAALAIGVAYRQTNNALRESERRYRAVVEASPAGIVILEKGIIRFANPAFATMLDQHSEDLTDKSILEFVEPEDQPTVIEALKEQEADEAVHHCEMAVNPKAREPIYIQTIAVPLSFEGRAAGLFMIQDITEQKTSHAALEHSLREKELLLKEMHHRVKNNMQIIMSLLNLKSYSVQDPVAQEALKDSAARIRSLALVHETLYKVEDFSRLDLGRYVHNLTGELLSVYHPESGVRLLEEVEDLELGIDAAVPCGLILTELITNSLKHGFRNGGRGTLFIGVRPRQDEAVELLVADHPAPDAPLSFNDLASGDILWRKDNPRSAAEGIGFQIIEGLARQLAGSFSSGPGVRGGYLARLVFKKRD